MNTRKFKRNMRNSNKYSNAELEMISMARNVLIENVPEEKIIEIVPVGFKNDYDHFLVVAKTDNRFYQLTFNFSNGECDLTGHSWKNIYPVAKKYGII